MNSLQKLYNNETAIQAKKDEANEFKTKGSTKVLEEELGKLKSEHNNLEGRIDDLNKTIREGVDAWKQVADARGDIREVFLKVDSRLSRDESNPPNSLTSNEKTQWREAIGRIRRYIQEEAKEHRKQEEGARETSKRLYTTLGMN